MATVRTLLCMLLLSAGAFASQKYVTVTASGGGNGTIGYPWTLDEAAQQAVAGDTVNIVWNATAYNTPLVPFASGTASQRIVYRGYNGRAKINVSALAYEYVVYNEADYITLEDLELAMYSTTLAGQRAARNLVYSAPGGDYLHIRRCWIHTDEDLWEMHATEAFVHGIFQWNSRYLLVENTKVERTRFHWFTTGNALPRYTIFRNDTLRYAWQSAIDFQSPTGPTYINQEILLEFSLLDSVLEEDGIQFEHDYTTSPYNGLLTPQHMGYVIRNNTFSRIAENAIDTKGGYKDIIFEGNHVWGVIGDDNGPFLGGSGGGRIVGRVPEDNNIQPAVQYHQVSSTGWHIMRFNTGWDCGGWNGMLNRLQNYHNTDWNMSRRWTGPNAPAESLTTQYSFVTANDYGPSYASYYYQGRTLFANNISGENKHGQVYLTHSNDSLHINGNAYYRSGGALRNYHRNPPYTWPDFTLTYVESKVAWQAELAKSWYSNTTGEDARALWNVDPKFISFPADAWGSQEVPGQLMSSSPMIDAAVPLAMVTANQGQGNTLTVDFPYPFFAGFPAIGVTGDSIIWGGLSGWDQNQPRRIIAINGNVLVLDGAPIFAEAGDSVWLWKYGMKVNDIGAWQYGQAPVTPGGGDDPGDPGDTSSVSQDTASVDWAFRTCVITVAEPTFVEMNNVQAHSVSVFVVNPNANPVTWDPSIIWLTDPPALVPGSLSWYTIHRSGDSLVGAMTGPTSGESAPVEWRNILGDPRLAGSLMGILNAKADTSALVRLDTLHLAGADTTDVIRICAAHQGKLYLIELPSGTGGGVDVEAIAGMIADSLAAREFLTSEDVIGYATVSAMHDSLGERADDYAATEHNHSGVYQPAGTYATPSSVADSLGARANDYADANHNHTGVYQAAGTYATPATVKDSLDERANDYSTVEHNHNSAYIAKTTKWVFTPQGFDSSLVYAGSVWPIYRGKNETVDSVFILTNGACNFQIQVYCGGTIGTPEDSLFSSPETVNTNSGQEVVTSFRNSGALGHKPWWLKVLTVTSKPVSFLLELTGSAP